MNIIVCDNIKDIAVQLHKQVEQQILDPKTTKKEKECLEEAKKSIKGAVGFLMETMKIEVERMVYKEEV